MIAFERAQKLSLAFLLAAGLAVAPALAQDAEPESADQTEQNRESVEGSVQEEAGRQLSEKRQRLISDAVAALDETEKALIALDEENTDEALEALAVATGKLELIVTRDPDLALAPVAVDLISHDVLADVETIRATRETIEDLVDDGEIQKARPLMRDFASELVISTSNLPIATYPDAIKLATAMIDDGDIDAAKRTLRTALATLVVTETVIPLPILRAELFISAAEAALGESGTAEASDASEEAEMLEPADYVEAARTELEIAEALGYGVEEDYAALRDDLRELDEKIEAEQDTGGIFDTIADSFSDLRGRIFGED